jgi:hypothetical protein
MYIELDLLATIKSSRLSRIIIFRCPKPLYPPSDQLYRHHELQKRSAHRAIEGYRTKNLMNISKRRANQTHHIQHTQINIKKS